MLTLLRTLHSGRPGCRRQGCRDSPGTTTGAALADAWRPTRSSGCGRSSESSTSPVPFSAATPPSPRRPLRPGIRCPPSPTTAGRSCSPPSWPGSPTPGSVTSPPATCSRTALTSSWLRPRNAPLDPRVLAWRGCLPRHMPRLRLLRGRPRCEPVLRARRPVRRDQDPVLPHCQDRPTRRSHTTCPRTSPLMPPRS